jgi:hypothetical protein
MFDFVLTESIDVARLIFMNNTGAKPMTFKSHRAAKIAFGKAERAYEAARSARIDAHHAAIAGGYGETYDAEIAPFNAAENAAFAHMEAVWTAAKDQNFYCHSYHLGHNPTRELIARNID